MSRTTTAAGFTLLEMIIVLSIMALLIGVAVPSMTALADSERITTTREEMTNLNEAILAFASDVERIPSSLPELANRSGSGWGGPYVDLGVNSSQLRRDDYSTDAWGNYYLYERTSSLRARITSYGADGVRNGTSSGDDLEIYVDITPALRDRTVAKLDMVNAAIARWNDVQGGNGQSLPTNAYALCQYLQSQGYLPNGSNWHRDAFGAYWSVSGNPVTYVYSSSFGTPP